MVCYTRLPGTFCYVPNARLLRTIRHAVDQDQAAGYRAITYCERARIFRRAVPCPRGLPVGECDDDDVFGRPRPFEPLDRAAPDKIAPAIVRDGGRRARSIRLDGLRVQEHRVGDDVSGHRQNDAQLLASAAISSSNFSMV